MEEGLLIYCKINFPNMDVGPLGCICAVHQLINQPTYIISAFISYINVVRTYFQRSPNFLNNKPSLIAVPDSKLNSLWPHFLTYFLVLI